MASNRLLGAKMKNKLIIILSCIMLVLALSVYSTFIDPIVLQGPPDGNVTSNSWIQLNWSVLSFNVSHMLLDFNSTNVSIGLGNCSIQNITSTERQYRCGYNMTGLSEYINHSWLIHLNTTDRDGKIFNTSDKRYIVVDTSGISIDNAYNWTIADSSASFNIQIGDYSTRQCLAEVLENNGTAWVNTFDVTGTIEGYTGAAASYGGKVNCTGSIDASLMTYDGDFIVQYSVTDALGNNNKTNKTGLYLDLASGWNLISWNDLNASGENHTTLEICDMIEYCTQVSWRNNSGDSFVTYDTTTPGVNNGTYITVGDAIEVYVSQASKVIYKDETPTESSVTRFGRIYNQTWNALGLITDSNLSTVYSITENGTTHQFITRAAWYDVDSELWYTCRRSTGRCTGTSDAPSNITLKAGHAVWVYAENINGTNAVINRTEWSS